MADVIAPLGLLKTKVLRWTTRTESNNLRGKPYQFAREIRLPHVVAENFRPGTMVKYGLDYAALSAANPRLIYASHKGSLPGPYDHRTALNHAVIPGHATPDQYVREITIANDGVVNQKTVLPMRKTAFR